MTIQEEQSIDAHILASSGLRTTSIGYKALVSLLQYGNFLSYGFRDYDIFVNFTKVLDHLQLEYKYIPRGLQLKENAKINYWQKLIKIKNPEIRYNNQSGSYRVGKEERSDSGGWIRTQNLKND